MLFVSAPGTGRPNKEKEMEEAKNEVGFLDVMSGDGTHDIKTAAPMLKILHFISPEVLPGDAHVKDAVAGAFFNTATKRVYGNTIEVVPVKAVPVWLEYVPKDKGGGFRGRHAVGSVPVIGDLYTGAYTKGGNEVVEALEFYCLVTDEMDQGLVLLSLTGSSIKHGKTWGTRIATVKLPSGKVQPFYGSKWKLTTALNQNAQGQQWYTLGQGKGTNAVRTAFINAEEYTQYVQPAVEFAKAFAIMAPSGGQALLSAPEEAEF
jgi:hypothetical protein